VTLRGECRKAAIAVINPEENFISEAVGNGSGAFPRTPPAGASSWASSLYARACSGAVIGIKIASINSKAEYCPDGDFILVMLNCFLFAADGGTVIDMCLFCEG
jgi:hypothetical protein